MEETLSRYSELNVLAFQIDPAGCGTYRIASPLLALEKLGAKVHIIRSWEKFNPTGIDYRQFTHVISQREVRDYMMELLVYGKEKFGYKLIYELDDDLHQIDPFNHAYKYFNKDVLHSIEKFWKHCDALFVSTPDLAGHYSRFHNRIYQLPNCIDFKRFNWNPPERDDRLYGMVVVGWAGGHTHSGDQYCLGNSLRRILDENSNVLFGICSSMPMMNQFVGFCDLPHNKVVLLEPVPIEQYPTRLQFDIGLAPLRDSEFNRAKSDLRLKEYGAMGIPYVATDISPYRRFHLDSMGRSGYLARGVNDWYEAMTHLIHNESERKAMSSVAVVNIHENHNIETKCHLWGDAMLDLMDRKNVVATWDIGKKVGRNDPCPCGSGLKAKRCCGRAYG